MQICVGVHRRTDRVRKICLRVPEEPMSGLPKKSQICFGFSILHPKAWGSVLWRSSIRKRQIRGWREFLSDRLHIDVERARSLHLHMLIYTVGIGTIFCTTAPGISLGEVVKQQESAAKIFFGYGAERCVI